MNCLVAAYEINRKPLSLSFKAFHSRFQIFSNIRCTFCFPIKNPSFLSGQTQCPRQRLAHFISFIPNAVSPTRKSYAFPSPDSPILRPSLAITLWRNQPYTVSAHTNYFPLYYLCRYIQSFGRGSGRMAVKENPNRRKGFQKSTRVPGELKLPTSFLSSKKTAHWVTQKASVFTWVEPSGRVRAEHLGCKNSRALCSASTQDPDPSLGVSGQEAATWRQPLSPGVPHFLIIWGCPPCLTL